MLVDFNFGKVTTWPRWGYSRAIAHTDEPFTHLWVGVSLVLEQHLGEG
jgi:hypothetical protein